ncbi:M35 family metallo-endopeptidase [Burkholderia sp. SRS-W-2-2016]|uniref:M35 family metallo-endopeptidase n=1 Tax=Burkholderia sp. SRS-W-2-2016 TaxID=1926878 RepID=UPI002115DB58|nr:M35 family metallo-endopeptidase [Burkholderia sp. SRS-W-2-2016]
MSDAEFRKKVLTLRDEALKSVELRIDEVASWNAAAQSRAVQWLGNSDEATRLKLSNGLRALLGVMKGLTAHNIVRVDSEQDRATGCVPGRKNLTGQVAHVCAPDTATHTIAINDGFCDLPPTSLSRLSSMQLTIVHECCHFIDTFGSRDYPDGYGYTSCKWLARDHPERAITNADSIAWYVLARY